MLKKFVILVLLGIIPTMAFARNDVLFVAEKTVTVNATTGGLFTIDYYGDVNLFSHAKVYFNLNPTGVTPNTSSKYMAAGGSANTEIYYTKNQKIGLLSDSGTATVNITITRKDY